jgi:hypothetical protein
LDCGLGKEPTSAMAGNEYALRWSGQNHVIIDIGPSHDVRTPRGTRDWTIAERGRIGSSAAINELGFYSGHAKVGRRLARCGW